VVVHGRNRERAEATAREITVAGGKAAVTVGDLELDEDANIVAADALNAFGGIDILVTNAGVLVRAENPHWTTVPPGVPRLDYPAPLLSSRPRNSPSERQSSSVLM
jgi:NAD(P)-dependent dehydrogenase (short-subunit alcohol dehydrogenase family)